MEEELRTLFLALTTLVAAVSTAPAAAHHSTAMFDASRNVVLSGTVRELQWTNPHSWVQLIVPGRNRGSTEWSLEGGSPNTLSRQGWTKTILRPGDKISVVINPMRDGSAAGLLISVTLPDGRVLGQRAAP